MSAEAVGTHDIVVTMDVVKSILENEPREVDPSKSTEVEKPEGLDIDLGTLLATDPNALDTVALRSDQEQYLKSLTRDNVQLLINKIWELPTERVDEAIVAKLPEPQFVLPRARNVPKPKPLTKWEQFAKEKGIQKKKKGKSKLQWDDELQKWIPAYGYKRTKAQEQKEWLVEMNDENKPVEDPFKAAKVAKQERQAKNELQRLRNIAKAKNVKLPRVGLPTREYFPDSQQLSQAVTVARMSTASVGKFQNRLSKEKDAKGIAKEVPGMKRKAKEPPLNVADEKRQNKGLAESVLKRKTKILREDLPASTPKVKSSKATKKTKRGGPKVKTNKGTRKPKPGKGQRDMRLKVGGRKRR